ncbi:GyrI-like domain-containing protein [Frankia sp. AgB1.9]|uniref:GyrI-like domain-containing protein n=1 Tax=unclassified Frankia TaxID=2632575 RepID=UPI0019348E57|nr:MULTISPECIES: GyrI-like domain-containing protein [unclassified Frankia]MBL7489652.1 GyrI-like domain-containing protein [Frankia sp. AgW1.1]MBL7548618.1 GyrI-like domain-containing protein [Frankia sp. AgB1.9]MBL7621570.1 GyrI-like domain-containing protein [Frankia sp. AgB1.8]
MTYVVEVETVAPKVLAAVRRQVRPGEVPTAFGAALDQVWAFLRGQPGLRDDGHNVFVYHHGVGSPDAGLDVDFGVEVTRPFPPQGLVECVESPAGRAALTVHRGGYGGLPDAHAAIHAWCREHAETIGAWSMEIYGDWHEDEAKIETTVLYALAASTE